MDRSGRARWHGGTWTSKAPSQQAVSGCAVELVGSALARQACLEPYRRAKVRLHGGRGAVWLKPAARLEDSGYADTDNDQGCGCALVQAQGAGPD